MVPICLNTTLYNSNIIAKLAEMFENILWNANPESLMQVIIKTAKFDVNHTAVFVVTVFDPASAYHSSRYSNVTVL